MLQAYKQSNDIKFLGQLFEKKVSLVYGVCAKYLKDEEQAKDAVMEIFEELAVKVKLHEIQHFHSWLYMLSKNYCLMQLRKGSKVQVISLDEFMEFSPLMHPDDDDKEEMLVALEKCLDNLTTAQKQSVSLFYLKEKCYKEIAELTGFTLNDVKSYIQNGKRNLKICLDKNGG